MQREENSYEITFDFKFRAGILLDDKNEMIQDLVKNFVEFNNLLCGGGISGVGIYDEEERMSSDEMLQKLTKYLQAKHADKLDSIILTKFDEVSDEFINVKEIRINEEQT